MTQRVIEELSEEECFDLVGQEMVGRFVFQDAEGPAALPVNYGVAGRQIVFRTEAGSHFREVLQGPVAIEVDHTDAETGKGWSVLLRGSAREVDLNDVPELLGQMGAAFPHPWVEGVHNIWIALTPAKVTGRKLTLPYFAAIF